MQWREIPKITSSEEPADWYARNRCDEPIVRTRDDLPRPGEGPVEWRQRLAEQKKRRIEEPAS